MINNLPLVAVDASRSGIILRIVSGAKKHLTEAVLFDHLDHMPGTAVQPGGLEGLAPTA